LLVRFDLECDMLPFGQVLESRPFHRCDVNEHIAAAVIRFDEAVAAFCIEELDRPSHGHRETPPRSALPPLAQRVDPTGSSLPESLASRAVRHRRRPDCNKLRPGHSVATIRGSGT